jgi:transcription-repair coupling factor (superfamily II helicase)
VRDAAGSLPAVLIAELIQSCGGPVICLLPEDQEARYLHSDLAELLGEAPVSAELFPPTGHHPYDTEQIPQIDPIMQRADVLQAVDEEFEGVVVTSVDAVFERVPSPDSIERESVTLASGDQREPERLVEWLVGHGFDRVEFVEQPGEVALRGGILDVFPFTGAYPIRIDFFGDEIDSIREFDPESQRSVSTRRTARIVPDLDEIASTEERTSSLFQYFPDHTWIATFDSARLSERADEHYTEVEESYAEYSPEEDEEPLPPPSQKYIEGSLLATHIEARPRITFGVFAEGNESEAVSFSARPQPSFNSSISLLREKLESNATSGITTHIVCDSEGQARRLEDLLQDHVEYEEWYDLSVESIHEGFELPHLGLAVYTDHQIFNRFHRPKQQTQRKTSGGLSLRDLKNLSRGDFVVHIDYGIGRFDGLEKITVRGKQQESVRLVYKSNDVLYVNVSALYKLHKFTGQDGYAPDLTNLNSGQWERTKARTKKKVKETARELIELYAKRKEADGYSFSSDTVWQQEMEASFQYEDTPDQAKATEAVKEDMEALEPMDRLICGDVGFGKTEVAIRAAFKAVQDGKQVAMLVPTTVLCQQHYETFTERLKRFPVNIAVLSRFRTSAEQRKTVEELKEGTVDIVIGTHRLVSGDVAFNDLGLLIVDEEQRFGVKAKEKLKEMRVNVDTLTLTATPIPRTLQFSLLGVRDLSIINTPPPNRQSIVTEIHTFEKDLIQDAIQFEVSRGGQVFFLHNRVRTIEEVASMLRSLLPNVRFRVAHGQMKSRELEKVMTDLKNKKFDVMVCTSIIESGVDVPNANTMIINHAERFGLAELHQLRGRVGRSDRKAFCFLLTPSIHSLTRQARQRLRAVEEFSDLGSGFSLAMRDLDIRGAGNLLGAEQSGYIREVGFDTYHKILDEAVRELREEEFSDVFDEETASPPLEETTVDVDADAFIPQEYVSNNEERLNLYKRLSETSENDDLVDIREEMEDRFGTLPDPVEQLLGAAELKLVLEPLRLSKIRFKNERLFLTFPPEEDAYFYDNLFQPLLERMTELDRRYVLKDNTKGRLRVIIQDVQSLAAALEVARNLHLEEREPVQAA